MTRVATFLGVLVLATASTAQDKPPDHTLRDFGRFTTEVRNSLIRQLLRKIQLDPNPAIQRIVSMQRSRRDLPVAIDPPYHRAAKWAKGVAPDRELVGSGDPRHQPVRARFPAREVLPDLHKEVWYDWGRGMIVKRAKPLSDTEVMENIYHGYPPGSDDALARLLKTYDNDPRARPVAMYMAHLYADLEAKVFADVTLYDAWYSGEVIDIPDVDAIPFARRILKTRAYKSPIPKSPKRTQLYQRIRDAAFAYRKYRTLREAAAAAFLRADPVMDPTYKPLIPRFHYLYVVNSDDVAGVEKLLRQVSDRLVLLQRIDALLNKSPGEYEKRKARKKNLQDMYAWLHYWAQLAVYQQNQRQKAAGK